MYYNELVTRAQDYTSALASTLPEFRFEVYTTEPTIFLYPPLYLMGFHPEAGLVGGYTLESPVEETMFPERVVSLAQFFHKACDGKQPRFYPSDLQILYEVHRDSGALWQRIA
jgi:hypothetical protein